MYAIHNPGLGAGCKHCGGQTFLIQETGFDEYYQCFACSRTSDELGVVVPVEVGRMPLARRNRAIDGLRGITDPPPRRVPRGRRGRPRKSVGTGE